MSKYLYFLIFTSLLVGCATTGKYVEPRSELDRSLYYRENDSRGKPHEISRAVSDPPNTTTRIPQPALVDRKSTVEIIVFKNHLLGHGLTTNNLKIPGDLLIQKQRIVKAIEHLEEVVQARQKAIESYKTRSSDEFARAKKDAANKEQLLISKLEMIWPDGTEEYYMLDGVYDPPLFSALQDFLQQKIIAIETGDSEISLQLAELGRKLTLEAFLNSPGKEAVAVHLEGYDSIKEGTLQRHDRFGLDLSAEERARLDAQANATQNLAATLERLRKKEATLNQTVQEIRTSLAPNISELIDDSEEMLRRLDSTKLKERKMETDSLFAAYFKAVKEKNQILFRQKIDGLEQEKIKLLTSLPIEADQFAKVLEILIFDTKELKKNWEKVTPATIIRLVDDTSKAATRFKDLKTGLPEMVANAKNAAALIIENAANGLSDAEQEILLHIPEAEALRNNLETYYIDFRATSRLVTKITTILQGVEIGPVASVPEASLPFRVPIENVQNTFLNLEKTQGLPGDSFTIKGTIFSKEEKIIGTTSADFVIDKYGYFAELSPAVVLIKPYELKGGDDGFRFAPILSWMHHWAPRPEDNRFVGSFSRAFDPALGIHSAFTNFNSPASNDNIQIGLGMTLSFWKNRLQAGTGYNLMADSTDQGRYYFFIGSDLIGILQTVGVVSR